MHKTHHISNDVFIAYKEHKSKKNLPTIVSLHGLFSSLESSKAVFMHDLCVAKDLPFIRFNALGHEHSSGKFTDQSIDSWLSSAKDLISTLCPNGAILIGSSMGGWVSLLLARDLPKAIKGVICISPAADFTEDIYNSLSDEARSIIDNQGIVTFSVGPYTYNISHNLIHESRNHLLLNSEQIDINCPIHILHGMNDQEVSYKKSLVTIDKITSENALCTLVKTGTHSLSGPEDLKLLENAIMNMI